jgi:putative endonuclease
MDKPPLSESSRHKGYGGEDRAVEYLLSQGYRIISRNYQARDGEIDCIAEAPDATLVFFEVKSAWNNHRGHPFSWITRKKQQTIIRLARRYLADHGYTSKPCRLDAIAIVGGRVEHLKNAFLQS